MGKSLDEMYKGFDRGQSKDADWKRRMHQEMYGDWSQGSNNANNSIRVKAQFVGKESLGYTPGREYYLIIENSPSGLIIIRRPNGQGRCPYESIISFLKNWAYVTDASDALGNSEARGLNTDGLWIESV